MGVGTEFGRGNGLGEVLGRKIQVSLVPGESQFRTKAICGPEEFFFPVALKTVLVAAKLRPE